MAEPPAKRFRYESYSKQISHLKLDTGNYKPKSYEVETTVEEDDAQTVTPLTTALSDLSLNHLCTPYVTLTSLTIPLSRTLPLTLLNASRLQSHFHDFFTAVDASATTMSSGLDGVLVLYEAFFATLLGEGLEYGKEATKDLLRIGALNGLEAKLIEATYSSLSAILKTLSSPLFSLPSKERTSTVSRWWTNFTPYFSSSRKQYVRNCVAEVWAVVLRRARGEISKEILGCMVGTSFVEIAQDDKDEKMSESALAAVLAESMKGAPHLLHSRGVHLYSMLVGHLLWPAHTSSSVGSSSEVGPSRHMPSERLLKTMVLLTTTLIHHTSATNLLPIHELLLSLVQQPRKIDKTSGLPSGTIDTNQQRLVLRLLSVLVAVRKGQKVPEVSGKSLLGEYTKTLIGMLPVLKENVDAEDESRSKWITEFLRLTASVLVAGKLGDWIKGGAGLIDGMWDILSVPRRFRFARVMIKLKWKGLEQFLLGHVAKTCSTSLTSHPLETTSLLSSLAAAGFLDGGLINIQAGRWKDVLAKGLGEVLGEITRGQGVDLGEDESRTMKHIFKLLPKLYKSSPSFMDAVSKSLRVLISSLESRSQADLRADFASKPFNKASILASALACVADLKDLAVDLGDMEGQLKEAGDDIVEKLGWHRQVLREMARLVGTWQEVDDMHKLEATASLLGSQILSEDSMLREAALNILAAFKQPIFTRSDPHNETFESPNFFKLCIEVEDAGMSLQNVRERSNKIRAIGLAFRLVDSTPADMKWLVRVVVDYLLSQLKVNFRPLYQDTIGVLTELAEQHAELIWEATFGQLEHCMPEKAADLRLVAKPAWASSEDAEEEEESTEELKGFHCPNASRLDRAVEDEVEGEPTAAADQSVTEQVTSDRLDDLNYEAQLLAMLGSIPSISEKHARSLVPLLLQLGSSKSTEQDDPTHDRLGARALHAKLQRHLELFAKFTNPKALYRADDVHALYLQTLSIGDAKLQEVALECVLTLKASGINPYAERLRNLLKEPKFRDELANFSLSQTSGEIDPAHRRELIPVVTRLLYGIMTSRKGRNSSSQGSTQRRNAILAAMAGMASAEFETLVQLMLAAFPAGRSHFTPNGEFKLEDGMFADVSSKQKSGYLSLLGDVLRHLGPQIAEHWTPLLAVDLQIVYEAQVDISKASVQTDDVEEEEDVREGSSATLRNIRTMGLKRFGDFFRAPVDFNFDPFMPATTKFIISPRVSLLDRESTQAPSALMEIFVTWALDRKMVAYLVRWDEGVLPKLFACLAAPKVKPTVCSRIMDAVERIIAFSLDEASLDGFVTSQILQPHVGSLLEAMVTPLQTATAANSVTRDVLFRREVGALAKVAGFVHDAAQAQVLVELLLPTLKRPGKQVSEPLKVDILTALVPLLRLTPASSDPTTKFYQHTTSFIATLFRSLNGRQARIGLCDLYRVVASASPELFLVCDLVTELNAFSGRRMDEPDFERRLKAFARLNDELYSSLSTRQWLPVLYNLFFYLQDAQEFSIRSNAGQGIKRYVQTAIKRDNSEDDEVILNVVYPAIRNVLNSKHELVRGEAMSVLATMVQTCQRLPVFEEMLPLLAAGDDEASVFSNIYHIQVHRRTRALRRLGDLVATGAIREATLIGVFLPVVMHFIRQAAEGADHHLTNEAMLCLGRISRQLGWSKYLATTLQLLRLAKVKGPGQKFSIRALTSVLENFHFAMEDSAVIEEDIEVPLEEQRAEDDIMDVEEEARQQADKTDATARHDKVVEYLSAKLLPALAQFLEQKDEAEATIRIPVALGIIRVTLALPEETRGAEISRILTILSQVLRSKDQDTRDLVRETMCKVAKVLGPYWLAQVIKDLRAALQRGPQLHVLAVTTHAILVHVTTEAPEAFNNLDEAVGDIVHISAEVIWGKSGKDVIAEGFRSKMREVKSANTRAYDNFQLVSRLVTPTKINNVLVPLRNIMRETSALQPMQQVDDALRRIATGLNSNPSLGPTELLRLCHTLMTSSVDSVKSVKAAPQEQQVKEDYRVQMKRKSTKDVDHSAENIHRFVAFGLDLFVTAFRRARFDFADADILARLSPMVNVIGNCLYSSSTLVQGLALKGTAAIVKCPLPSVERTMPTFVKQIFAVIKRCGGAESELAQTAMKSLAVIIRDCKMAELKEQQVTYLLEIIGPDLEDADRQAALFTLLKAILSRRFVVPEIYDLMEKVSTIMVTSQSAHVQELCRSSLIQFLLDYPQGKGRLRAQMTFLAQNLSYVYESGRISVMELLSAVFTKFSDALVQEYADLFFLALVMVIANDDAEKCRAIAGELLKQLLRHYEGQRLEDLLEMLSQWTSNAEEKAALARASMIVGGLLLQSDVDSTSDVVARVVINVNAVLKLSAEALQSAESLDPDSAFAPELDMDFSLPHQALITLSRCLDADSVAFDEVNWTNVVSLLLYPHDWVRLAAGRAITRLLSRSTEETAFTESSNKSSGPDTVLSSAGLLDLARKSCILLSSRGGKGVERYVPSEALCGVVVKILFAIGQRWTAALIATGATSRSGGAQQNDEGAASDSEDDGQDAHGGDSSSSEKSPVSWLMSRLSFIARSLILNRPSGHEQIRSFVKWTPPLSAILQFFAAMADVWAPTSADERMDVSMLDESSAAESVASKDNLEGGRRLLEKFLPHILTPVYRVLDEEGDVRITEGDAELESLHALCTEIRSHLQSRAGMTSFSTVWENLRKRTQSKRGGRRKGLDDLAIQDPQAFAKRKEKRGEMKRDNKKRKNKSYADAKIRERPMKKRG